MAKSKYEHIWQLLSTNDFKDQMPQKFHCTICRRATIKPFVSLCECRFCSHCIREYLKDGNKNCPGGKQECLEDILELDVNITRDLVAVRNIGRLIVKCLNKSCNVKCEIESMSEHLRICGMSTTKCPYETMGCQVTQISRDNMKSHYENEGFIHSQLLVESIDNLKNEMDGLRNLVEKKDEQITKINEDSERNKLIIMEMIQQINEQRIEIDVLKDKDERRQHELEVMGDDLKLKETQMNTMTGDMNNLKKDFTKMNMTMVEMKGQINEQSVVIYLLNDKDGRKESELEVISNDLKIKEAQSNIMMEELVKVKKDIVEMDVRRYITDQNKILNDLKTNQENIEREISSVCLKLKDLEIYDNSDFIWRVDNFSKMRHDRRWREIIFWRYSIKFVLSLRCYGDYLSFDCNILKGKFDYVLTWPMKHKITLSLLNQNTMEAYKSREYSYDSYKGDTRAFDKPRYLWNSPIGDPRFATVEDVGISTGVILNDSLIVSFNIK